MVRCALAALSLVLACASLVADDACDWLAARDVDAALPEVAPWSVLVGGAGSCKFVTSVGPPNVFGANRMVKASPEEAARFVGVLRESMAESYTVAPATDLGTEGFTYRPRSGELAERSIYFVGHEGRLAVIASLSLQEAVGEDDVEAAKRLVRAALTLEDTPAALAALTDCRWFVADVLRKLLPGDDFSQQSFGANSCLAQAGGTAVIVSVVALQDPASVARMGTGQCTVEPVPALGPGGQIAWACEGGRPHAKVSYVRSDRLIEYSLVPDREPTEAERALLVELAVRASAPSD